LLGLAIYARELSANEVSEHYRDWQEGKTGDLANLEGIRALYTFDERGGGVIHKRAGSAPNLVIPKRFKALHKEVLHHHFDPRKPGWNDIIVNIVGFVPFGFITCATLRAARFSKISAVGLAILLGGVTSVTIELLQVYLPSRDSSLLDLLDNTLGTALGAMFFIWIAQVASPKRTCDPHDAPV
jgi:VanZ family protein